MKISHKIDLSEFERSIRQLQKSLEGAVENAARAGGKVIEQAADAKAPGPHITSKITDVGANHAEVSIGPDEEHWYYRFHEFGASAHQIKAREAQLLSFEGRRGRVLVPSVNHPGMAAHPFLRPAITQNKTQATQAAGDEFRKAMKK